MRVADAEVSANWYDEQAHDLPVDERGNIGEREHANHIPCIRIDRRCRVLVMLHLAVDVRVPAIEPPLGQRLAVMRFS